MVITYHWQEKPKLGLLRTGPGSIIKAAALFLPLWSSSMRKVISEFDPTSKFIVIVTPFGSLCLDEKKFYPTTPLAEDISHTITITERVSAMADELDPEVLQRLSYKIDVVMASIALEMHGRNYKEN